MNTRAAEEHGRWIAALLQRYERALAASGNTNSPYRALFNSLQLADALLDKLALNKKHPQHALQLVVMGPTQSGKSTLVNTLLDCHAAGISALAGFTVHAQGYATGLQNEQLLQLEPCLTPLHRVPAAELDAKDLEAYVLEHVTAGSQSLVDTSIVWDTPDFDSIDASSYKRSVLNAVALADILVLMVSKDKYGDKSVWDMLELLHPFNQTLIVCINKLDEQDEEVVSNAFHARYAETFNTQAPPLVKLPFLHKSNTAHFSTANLSPLRQAIDQSRSTFNRVAMEPSVTSFIKDQKSQWLAPLIAERDAAMQWQLHIEKSLASAEERYARDYLNNPDNYNTFNRALAELLTLLEIPGLAPGLARTRQLVTWPARKLFSLAKPGLQLLSGKPGELSLKQESQDQEEQALSSILDSTLISLQSVLLDQPQDPFWLAMNRRFRLQNGPIRKAFEQESKAAREDFQPQIEAAAQHLYAQLQAQPVLLNTLRAARVTADAAGVALAVKSGGLAVADLVFAPAMLSVTTLLTESALGRYLDTLKSELKAKQQAHIKKRLFEGELGQRLSILPTQLEERQLFAQDLEPELLAELTV